MLLLFVDSTTRAYRLRGATPTSDLQQPPGRSQQTELQPVQRDYLEKARISAQSLLGIINDILDFSKVEAGRIELIEEPFELYDMMKTLATVTAANARDKDIEVLFHIEHGTPDQLIGDRLRLQQVLTNIAGNAVKFCERGDVLLSVSSEITDGSIVRLCFEVRDTGIGISRESLPTIFEAFSQGDASTTRRYGGTGLGLTICQRLVALMGGELTVDSEIGRGSTFRITVPLRYQPISAKHPDIPAGVPRNIKVLVVDDNATALQVMAAMIEPFGWRVVLAASGEEALKAFDQAAASEPFDLLLLDWCMPDIGGREIIQHVQSTLAHEELPVILVVTAFQFEQVRLESVGASSIRTVLTKPVTPSLLLDAIAAAFKKGGESAHFFVRSKSARLDGMKLLLVEDNSINQMVARKLLESAGAEVVIATNGTDALSRLAVDARRFNAVLMDIQMPGMDGYEVTRSIRERLGLTDIPVIAMTANALPADREQCLAAGMVDHIGKPFDVHRMTTVIAHHARPRVDTCAKETVAEIDLVSALERTMGDTALLRDLMADFVQQYSATAKDLSQRLAEADFKYVARMAHELKGVGSNLGMATLSAHASDLDLAARSGNAKVAASRCQEVCDALLLALAAAHRYVEAMQEEMVK